MIKNIHSRICSTISDTSNNLVHLEESNDLIDERIVFDCIENIILNIKSNVDNELSSVTGTLSLFFQKFLV